MPRILILTSGLTGIINASMELSNRLLKNGHEVLNASFRDRSDIMKANDFEWYTLPEVKQDTTPALPSHIESGSKIKRWWYKYANRQARQLQALNDAKPSELKALVKKYRPDLVFCDVELHEYIIMIHHLKVPFIILSQWFNLYERKGLPHLLTDTIPNEGEAGSQASIDDYWSRMKSKRAAMFTNLAKKSRQTDRHSVLRMMREEYDFPQKYVGESSWPAPYLYEGLPMVSMTMQELEFPFENQEWHTYIGPMVYADRKSIVSVVGLKNKFNSILDKEVVRGQRIISCTISTMHTGGIEFIHTIIEVARRNIGWSFFIGLGGKVTRDSLGDIPSNCIVDDFLPQLQVLAKAHVSINHGGIHTINECIHYAVPMLIYSGKVSDQNGCAARVHFHKIGIMADRDQDGAEEIIQKLKNLLDGKSYRRNIVNMQSVYLSDQYSTALENILVSQLNKESE